LTRTLHGSALCLLVAAVITGAALVVGKVGHAGDGAARPFALRQQALVGSRVLGDADSQLHQTGAPTSSADPTSGLDPSSPSSRGSVDTFPASELAADGIPVTALTAYENAAGREAGLNAACGLSWPLLAGIGRVESDHGRFAGAVLHSDGLSTPRVIGIPLDGNGTALIRDTDNGALDGDTVYDRAVGPMQFIPSTWAGWGVDANADGTRDPFNVFDAAAAAADYLCAAGRDLTTARGQVAAILSYNWSWDYVHLVMSLERVYANGVGLTVPVLPTSPNPHQGRPVHDPELPPVDPGTPRGAGSGGTGSGGNGSGGNGSTSSATPTPRPSGSHTTPAPSSGSSTPPSTVPGSSSSGGGSSDPGTPTSSTPDCSPGSLDSGSPDCPQPSPSDSQTDTSSPTGGDPGSSGP
jgi:membrane-bound lytic murein transglycosylase B